ncbi:hypothetical protein [Burkholderia ubonensis]|uniref:hypothetical protein n=1 Tax=Burkholderia ubonensis TaxID=101571 RepID=UPI0008FE7917
MSPIPVMSTYNGTHCMSEHRESTRPDQLDDLMKWLYNDFKQQVMCPDPDDPSACPTFNGNGTW